MTWHLGGVAQETARLATGGSWVLGPRNFPETMDDGGQLKYSWQRPGGVRASSSRPKLNLRESGRELISGGRTSSGSIAKELLYLSN